jgi:two-component system, NarL family, sensor histidine kinase DesK
MWLISRGKPGPEPGSSADDDLDTGVTGLLWYRRFVIRVLLVIFLLLPVVGLRKYPLTGGHVFLIVGTLAFVVLVERTLLVQLSEPGRYARWQWQLLLLVIALGASLFAVGGMSWLTALAVASAGVGRVTPDGRPTIAGLVSCTAIAVGISAATGLGAGNTLVAGAVVALASLLAHSAERRNVLLFRLKETRAELARAAVAEERLRISLDLHDLLGHSLSLIALKAELAGRVIDKDPARAAREIADLETVARRSLTEVRQAVTGYRQPSLAAELVSSRRMLASAGVDCRVNVPGAYSLPPAVDALLAWTVREGATNIVRHAAAKHAKIVIEVTDAEASARLSDDGIGPSANGATGVAGAGVAGAGVAGAAGPAAGVVPGTAERASDGLAGARPGAARPGAVGPGAAGPRAEVAPAAGSGLAGLAERAARLGGTLSAGAGQDGGFWLRVSVPLTGPPAPEPVAAAAPASGVTEPRVTEPRVTEARLTDPGMTEPDVTEPHPTGPGLTQPHPTDLGLTQPHPTDPGLTEPDVTEPHPTDPGLTEPDVTEPHPTGPGLTEPDVTEPHPTDPGPTDPGLTKPRLTEPGLTEPGLTGRDLAGPGLPDTGLVPQ